MFQTIFIWLKEYGTLLLQLIKTYGKKSVLSILFIGAILLGISYIVDYKTKNSFESIMKEQEEIHNEKLIESQEVYKDVKQKLRIVLKALDCEYIYLIEYHNGSENMTTSFPFRKFDVTMDICKTGVPYVNTSQLKDEHITRYDIFDNEEFVGQQFTYISRDELKTVDYKLYQIIEHNEDIKWIYTYNLYYGNKLLGAVIVMSYKPISLKVFINQMHDLEDIFNSIGK